MDVDCYTMILSFTSDSNTVSDFQTQHQAHVQHLAFCRFETSSLFAAHKQHCTNSPKA